MQNKKSNLNARFLLLIGVPIAALILIYLFFAVSSAKIESSRIIVIPTDRPDKVTAQLVFGAQSKAGLVHYTEHLVWLSSIVDKDQSEDRHTNAWANNFAVGYWLSGSSKDLAQILQDLKRTFAPIDLPPEFVSEERNIVLREYDLRVKNGSLRQVSEDMSAFLYQGDVRATSVIGTPEQIKSLTFEDAAALQAATHIPDNATLLITGDITERQVAKALESSDWPVVEGSQPVQNSGFDFAGLEERTLRYPDPDRQSQLIFRHVVQLDEMAPISFDRLEAHAMLLRDILDTNLPGGLAGPLRFDAQITRSFGLGISPLDEKTIEFRFSAAPDRGVSLADLQAAFKTELVRIADSGIPQETYDRVLKRFEKDWPDWDDQEDSAAWYVSYVRDRLSAQRPPATLSQMKTTQQKLSLDTTNALLRNLLNEGRTAIALIGPKDRFE